MRYNEKEFTEKGAAMYRNPAHLLSLDGEPAARLLRACGTDESVVRNGSDYDRFAALAAVIPLCAGHALATALQADLQAATGLDLPLCSHTAPAFWRRWTDLYWYGQEKSEPAPTPCTECTPAAPVRLIDADVTRLPDPAAVAAVCPRADLAAFTDRIEAALPTVGYAALRLPSDYVFVRPDPYHAARAMQNIAEGEAFYRDLLTSQALRTWGEIASARDVTLLLMGGPPDAILALLAYLSDCNRLPRAVWLPDEPAHAARVSGLYASVGTGYILSSDNEREVQDAYAAVAPIGRATVFQMPR